MDDPVDLGGAWHSDAHTLLPRIDRGREDQRRWV
jgi:hypothetical protein